MRKLFVTYCLFFFTSLCAQHITVKCPTSVAVGQQFQLQYVSNTTDVKNFRIGSVPDAFELIYGPSTSTQQSFSMVNGRTTQSSSVTYTYVLMAKKNGTFVIPAAHAVVAGSNVSSQQVKISVSGKAQTGGTQSQQQPAQRVDRAGSRISGNDLFIRVTANKQRVYEQEPVLLTYKVYTQVELTQLEGKMPDLNGFHTQEIPLPQQKTFHTETINGKTYRCVTWSQYVMFPQMSGKLEIPSITFKGIVVQENPNVDPFEAFFNGGSGYIEVKKEIKAPAVNIQVMPLPAKPANFSSAVGKFSVTASVDKNTVRAGEPVNYKVKVTGAGNMKLIKMPELVLPKDFDKYDPKLTDKTSLTTEGITGSMTYDYLIVPRNKGQYTIPAMEFVYFDVQSASYKTVRTQPIQIQVEQGSGKGSVADYSEQNNNDISDILQGDVQGENPDDTFFGSAGYIVCNGLILLAFVALLVAFRKRAALMSDASAQRARKASKVAKKRLRKSEMLMNANKENDFYEECQRALWGYAGDKLNIPVEQLSRENISEKLKEKGVAEEAVSNYINAIEECEFARYAPVNGETDSKTKMLNIYKKAADAISNVVISALLLVCGVLTADAANLKADADAAYRSADYQKAVQLYKEELKNGMSAEVLHNLGNCYYRMDSIPQAILNYERAHKYSPANKKITHSLEIARNKTVDRMPSESEVIFAVWYKGLASSMSIDGWARLAMVALILSLISFLCYLFYDNMTVRRYAFYASVLLFLIFISGNVFAFQRKKYLTTHDRAVVISETVTVKSSPTMKSSDACTLHDGTVVTIEDRDMSGWYEVRLSDGREGWVLTKEVEEI